MLGVAVGGVFTTPRSRRSSAGLPPREAAAEPPASLTIERFARQARRLRAELLATDAGTPMARRLSVVKAYDDLLAEACRALDVPDTLTGMPPGVERDAERLHLESELEAAGLHLSV